MSITISLEGLQTLTSPETRAIALLGVDYNGEHYDWQVYVPESSPSLEQFMQDCEIQVQWEIDAREAEWATHPREKERLDPATGTTIMVPVTKEQVVVPYIPDYYAQRRSEYPAVSDQLDAFWKGPDSAAYTDMQARIQAVKLKYPKPGWMV